MPRKRLLSDSERKRRRDAFNRKYYKLHRGQQCLRMKLDPNQIRRWNLVKDKLNMNTDEEVLVVLLDSYCGKEETVGLSSQVLPIPSTSKSNISSTPILTEVSSIQRLNSNEVSSSKLVMKNEEIGPTPSSSDIEVPVVVKKEQFEENGHSPSSDVKQEQIEENGHSLSSDVKQEQIEENGHSPSSDIDVRVFVKKEPNEENWHTP